MLIKIAVAMIVSFELLGHERELFESVDFDGFCSPIELPEEHPEAAIVSSVDYIRPQDEFALYGQFLGSEFRVRDFKIEILRGMLARLALSPQAIIGNVDSFVEAINFLEKNGSEAEALELGPKFHEWLQHPVVAFYFGRHYAKLFKRDLETLSDDEKPEHALAFVSIFKELPIAAAYVKGCLARAERLLKR